MSLQMSVTPDQLRRILREGLAPINKRLDALARAILILSDNFPGSAPGQESHVRQAVEAALDG